MKKAHIQSRIAGKFVITADSKNTLAPASDRLDRQFYPRRKNQAWVSGTAFIAIRQNWLYLTDFLGMFLRQAVGWG
jgi:putative transposase